MQPHIVESTFNQGLGEALRLTRTAWRDFPASVRVEMTRVLMESQSLRPDLIIDDQITKPVIVESSFVASDADKDAIGRLGYTLLRQGNEILSTIAVHIDEHFRALSRPIEVTDALLKEKPLRYALHQQIEIDSKLESRRMPNQGFIEGTVYDLAAFVSAEALPREKIQEVAEYVAIKIRQAADCIYQQVGERGLDQLTEIVNQRNHLNALHTTMVLWLNAIVVHQQLKNFAPQLQLEDATLYLDPVDPTDIYKAWNGVLKQNWHSVFQPAISVLLQYMNQSLAATSTALTLLIDAARRIEISRVGVHMNIGAELFPKLADDRKESAAFYTQPATAELLARLTIREQDLKPDDWAEGDLFKTHSIADLACGTGTLLRAGYRNVKQLHERFAVAQGSRVDTNLHRHAMEQGLIGADISPVAAHLTTSSLALMNIRETYGETKIGWLQVGGANGRTGSLEYLKETQASDFFDQLGGTSAGASTAAQDETLVIDDGSIDWALMNPPYSRTRSGQSAFDVAGLSESMRRACQRRWHKLTADEPLNNKAGMAASFLVIAKKKVKPGGRIGFVLPLTAAFAPSWQRTRVMLFQEFHDIIAIGVAGGKAIGKQALSADTGMEEMLLIATKSNGTLPHSPSICFVTLREPLNSVGVAGEIANAIFAARQRVNETGQWYPIRLGDDDIGHVLLGTMPDLSAPWSPLAVMSPHLVGASSSLLDGTLRWKGNEFKLGVSMSNLERLFEVGPTHHLIGHIQGADPIGAFEMHAMHPDDPLIGPDLSLWHVESNTQRQFLVKPTHKAVHVPSEDRSKLQATIRDSMSTLLYSRNMRWTSQALKAAITEVPVFGGSSWTTLQHQNDDVLWAFLLWANSTFGMIVHWTQGQRTHAGRSTTQIGALRAVPCPQLDMMSNQALSGAAATAKKLQHKSLLPACQAHCDPVRKEIDQAVVDMFGLPAVALHAIDQLRYLWCSEPSVHGQNQRALALLQI